MGSVVIVVFVVVWTGDLPTGGVFGGDVVVDVVLVVSGVEGAG